MCKLYRPLQRTSGRPLNSMYALKLSWTLLADLSKATSSIRGVVLVTDTDQTRCCHVHVQRCHGDVRELRRLLYQLEAEVDKFVHIDALFVRHRWRGRQCLIISWLLRKHLNSFKLGNALQDTT